RLHDPLGLGRQTEVEVEGVVVDHDRPVEDRGWLLGGCRAVVVAAPARHREQRSDGGQGGNPDPSTTHASEWVTGSSPIHSRRVFFSLICWMKMSCSGPTCSSVTCGDLK